MQTTTNQYEYSYVNSDSGHHHVYLLDPLFELISEHNIALL